MNFNITKYILCVSYISSDNSYLNFYCIKPEQQIFNIPLISNPLIFVTKPLIKDPFT
jgi:hypothetical protein